MLRRVLPVAAAAAFVLVPSTASATPAQAPVENYQGSSFYGVAQDVVLSNGWHATATLSEGKGTNQRQGWGGLSLDVWTTYDCFGGQTCTSHSFAYVELTDEQVAFDRSLRSASVHDIPVELADPTYVPPPSTGPFPWTGGGPLTEPWTPDAPADADPGAGPDQALVAPPVPATLTFPVTLAFTGSGPVDRTAGHSTMCADGDRTCQSVRVEATRDAGARLTLGDANGETTAGSLFHGHTVDAAVPKFSYGGN